MMKVIGSLLFIYGTLVFAGESKSLFLRGRVPASASVEMVRQSDERLSQAGYRLTVNAPKERYTVLEHHHHGHKIVDIIFH